MPAELPTGTVTLLFTDIEGSTRMLQELGREAYVRALTEHRRLLREAFTDHGGVEVEMQGDSFFFAFPYAREAVAAAVAAQRALAEHAWESQRIKVRIGLHTGEPMQADGLYAGLDVHWAARVMSAAHGGQVILSARTADLVEGELDVALVDLGEHRLKDLTAPQRLYQAGEGEFPPPKALSPRTNLPVTAGPLIGRERELAELRALVVDGPRVVTVTGTGGTGKTRLSLQTAADVVEAFPDGVFWIPLAALADAELVVPSIGQTLGLREPIERELADKRCLLVLDNFEHLIEAAPAVSRVLAGAPAAKALVTSRAPLQIEGEHEFALDTLDDGPAALLFLERSRAAGGAVDDEAPVADICRRLDNLPLAIELAAARSKLLDPHALLARLDHSLVVLTAGRRDAPERQRTLRATIDWSYELLDDEAQALFARLAVFAGDFSLEAAEAVCEADLNALQALVDLSLLKPIQQGRFLMLETVREYAAERLALLPDWRPIRKRHAEWFGLLAKTQARGARDSDQETLALLEREAHNFRAALATSVELALSDAGARLLTGLWFFLGSRGYAEELERWARLVVALPPVEDVKVRAEVLAIAGEALRFRGDFAGARAYKEEALPLQRTLGNDRSLAPTLTDLASLLAAEGDLDEAEQLALEALSIRERLGDQRGIAHARGALAEIAFWRGDYETALRMFEQDRATYRALGITVDEGQSAHAAGSMLRRLGRLDEAARRLQEGLELAVSVDDVTVVVEGLRELAAVAHALGNDRGAAVVLGGVERMSGESGLPMWDQADFDELVTAVRTALAPDELESSRRRGAGLNRPELINVAIEAARVADEQP